jgi:hypothetical protein
MATSKGETCSRKQDCHRLWLGMVEVQFRGFLICMDIQ